MTKGSGAKGTSDALDGARSLPGSGFSPAASDLGPGSGKLTPQHLEWLANEASLRYRKVILAFSELSSWPTVEDELRQTFQALNEPLPGEKLDQSIRSLRNSLRDEAGHEQARTANQRAGEPLSLRDYVRFLLPASLLRELVPGAATDTGLKSKREAILESIAAGFITAVQQVAVTPEPVSWELASLKQAVSLLTKTDLRRLGLPRAANRPSRPQLEDLTTPGDSRDAWPVEQVSSAEEKGRAKAANETATSPAGADQLPALSGPGLHLPPVTPLSKIEREIEHRFREYAEAHPDLARDLASRLTKIAEASGGLSRERTLGLREAARRISKARGIDLHSTQLLRYFRDPRIEIGAQGSEGKPRFSEYECANFIPPDRPLGRPKKNPGTPS